jgi:hypothetical protein
MRQCDVSLQPQLDILRPFQKRALLLMQAHKLLGSLHFFKSLAKRGVIVAHTKEGGKFEQRKCLVWGKVQ